MQQAAGSGGRPNTRGHTGARPSGRLALGVGVLVVALAALAIWPTLPARADHDPYCYVVGDQSRTVRILSRVTKDDFNSTTNELTIGEVGTLKTDGMALHPVTGVLYGVDTDMLNEHGTFGTISLTTGAFTAIGSGLGTANGSLGPQTLFDPSGFTFDPVTGFLYATHIRIGEAAVDLLYRVNTTTGAFVPNAFGPGNDYVTLPLLAAYPELVDVDDIAIDPATGQMYGILNNSGVGDRLIKINKLTGATSDVGPFGVAEVEGLDFDPHGQLWATAGGVEHTEANKLYEVNKTTGAATNPRLLNNAARGNYEALACMTPALNVPTPTPGDPALNERTYLPLILR